MILGIITIIVIRLIMLIMYKSLPSFHHHQILFCQLFSQQIVNRIQHQRKIMHQSNRKTEKNQDHFLKKMLVYQLVNPTDQMLQLLGRQDLLNSDLSVTKNHQNSLVKYVPYTRLRRKIVPMKIHLIQRQ